MNGKRTFLIVAVAALLVALLALGFPGSPASAQTGDGFDLSWHVMAGGGAGGPLSGDGFSLRSTVSQLVIGPAGGAPFELGQGYWYGGGGAFSIYLPLVLKNLVP